MDLDLDLDLDLDFEQACDPVGDPRGDVAAADLSSGEQAQAIHCGGLHIAVPYRWARSIVEQFDLSPVPNAPPWLAGAANIDGRCVAVVDLAPWLNLKQSAPQLQRSRLLLGGDGDEALALRFQGLPMMVRATALGAAEAADAAASVNPALPTKLAAYVCGSAVSAHSSARLPLLDLPALARAWAEEIAL